MILIIFCCILSLSLLCPKFGIAKKIRIFWGNFFSSNVLCVKNMTNRKSVSTVIARTLCFLINVM